MSICRETRKGSYCTLKACQNQALVVSVFYLRALICVPESGANPSGKLSNVLRYYCDTARRSYITFTRYDFCSPAHNLTQTATSED